MTGEIYRRIGPRFGIVADKAREKISREYRAVFYLGCQGPDIFYHNQRTRPVALEYGGLLHRRGYGLFSAILLKMGLPDPPPDAEDIRLGRREKGINALGVYSLGFMTHAVLDRFCHPYIVYKSQYLDPENGSAARKEDRTGRFQTGPKRANWRSHPFFERILDVLMLKALREQEPADWDQGILAGVLEHPPLGLKELLCRALIAGFPERAGKDRNLIQRIDNAFVDAARFYRLTAPQKTSLRSSTVPGPETDPGILAYLYPEQLSSDIDFLNLNNRPWFDPGKIPAPEDETPDTRSFPEIYAEAVKAAADSLAPCITEYLDSGVFPIRKAALCIGNGGLSIQDAEGKPCAPRRASALPLERVLAEQAELRWGRTRPPFAYERN
ncbi:MAG: zinc dependent phospholipase C family protein [Treponema sp.]|nr:zinc dependent phospholipase C family protein [Treponema sp.]